MGRLLASTPSIEAMEPVLAKFFCEPGWTIDQNLVIHAPDGHTPSSVVVRKSGKRYRLEMV